MLSSPTLIVDPHIDDRNRIDQEIAELEARLISLRKARNALAPIARLHPEIMQEIFYLVHISSEHKGRGSLLVTWISHKWRELAHHTSSLWSHIDFKRLEWIENALSRSKHRELEFELDCTPRQERDLSPLMSLLLKNISRIRRLVMVSRYGASSQILSESTSEWMAPAPLLVNLQFQRLFLPPRIFSGVCPLLQSLHITSCAIDWHTLPITPGLRELVIQDPNSRTSVEHLVKIFQVIGPGLETLVLEHVFNQDDSIPLPNLQPTQFRFKKLTQLSLVEDTAEEVERLVNRISLPAGGGLGVEVVVSQYGRSKLAEAFVSSRGIEKWPVKYLDISTDNTSITIRISEDWSQMDDCPGDDQITDIQFEISDSRQPSELFPILALSPIHPIKTVVFNGGSYHPRDKTILSYVGTLGTVRKLHLELAFFPTFRSLIEDQAEKIRQKVYNAPERGEAENIVELSVAQSILSFHNLEFLEIFGDPVKGQGLTVTDTSSLQRWLEWRKEFGLPLERFSLVGINVQLPLSWIRTQLRNVVGEVQDREVTEEDPNDPHIDGH
ncbi:hypothetical protein BDN72DRAFT_839998 [Pluteus cervinus]|uniref:Uncharacterized protein n=1 Tax=Pluteus cervinus TaxID=181527 RepID=A0ACD3AWK5_9AGAR|nr:hypothetical protein BDN72DRAFT_839998 [Pluteus cervinus]